jgi:hypothetical protein
VKPPRVLWIVLRGDGSVFTVYRSREAAEREAKLRPPFTVRAYELRAQKQKAPADPKADGRGRREIGDGVLSN